MNLEMITGLLVTLSRHGIYFCDKSTSLPPLVNPGSNFSRPFYPLQKHAIMELICRLEGEPAICINGQWTVYSDDRVKVFIPGALHTEHCSNNRKTYQLLWCTIFEQSLFFHLTAYAPGKGYFTSNKRLTMSPPMLRKLWESSIDPKLALSSVNQAEFHCLLMDALCFFIKNAALFSSTTGDFHEQVIEHLKTYIDEHYWEKLSLEELSSVFHYSPKHLNTLFKKSEGTPLLNYVSALRMQKSQELLRSGTMLVKQVADAVGIHDPLYFSKKFRRHFGQTPQSLIPGP
ncbi:MAG: AraC family transcriptional regulator [bacterium]